MNQVTEPIQARLYRAFVALQGIECSRTAAGEGRGNTERCERLEEKILRSTIGDLDFKPDFYLATGEIMHEGWSL